MLGNIERYFVVKLDVFRFGLLLENGNAHLDFRRLDLNRKAPVETRNQPVLKTRNIFRISITN